MILYDLAAARRSAATVDLFLDIGETLFNIARVAVLGALVAAGLAEAYRGGRRAGRAECRFLEAPPAPPAATGEA